MRGLLDTSVVIAREQARPIDESLLPDESAVSVVTLGELELGVHLASTERARATRLQTLRVVSETYVALPIEPGTAAAFARLVAEARRGGHRPAVQDCWIAATALAHDVAVYTRDADFDDLAVDVVRV